MLWPLEPFGRDGFQHSRPTRKHKSHIPCPVFGESRFLGNSQIPDHVNIFIVFPIPAPYFSQISNPENTLPDPVYRVAILITKRALTCRMLLIVWNLLLKEKSVMKRENKQIIYANTYIYAFLFQSVKIYHR